MLFEKLKLDRLLNDETNEEEASNHNTVYISVFFLSIIATVCMLFIEIKFFLLTLFAPAIIMMVIKPPFSKAKKIFRLISLAYLLFLAVITYFWYVR